MEKPLTDDLYLTNASPEMVQANKNTTFLVILLLIVCTAMGCGILFYRGVQPQLVKLCSFLLLGVLFAAGTSRRTGVGPTSFMPVMLAVAAQAAVVIFSIVTKRFDTFSHLSFFAAFLLPTVVVHAWMQFVIIPQGASRIWQYSRDIPVKPTFTYFENRPVRFKIVLPDEKAAVLHSTAPMQMKVGMAFYYGVQEQDEEMKSDVFFFDENGRPYKWQFYTVSFGGRKYLDPDESLYENHVSAKSTIVVERLY